jgi:hypothetical protein
MTRRFTTRGELGYEVPKTRGPLGSQELVVEHGDGSRRRISFLEQTLGEKFSIL